ncbi:hypothetical protein ACROYT_G012968 [Oculina patagonica]
MMWSLLRGENRSRVLEFWKLQTFEVPQDTCLGRLVTALKCEVKTGYLAKKVRKWFDETQENSAFPSESVDSQMTAQNSIYVTLP